MRRNPTGVDATAVETGVIVRPRDSRGRRTRGRRRGGGCWRSCRIHRWPLGPLLGASNHRVHPGFENGLLYHLRPCEKHASEKSATAEARCTVEDLLAPLLLAFGRCSRFSGGPGEPFSPTHHGRVTPVMKDPPQKAGLAQKDGRGNPSPSSPGLSLDSCLSNAVPAGLGLGVSEPSPSQKQRPESLHSNAVHMPGPSSPRGRHPAGPRGSSCLHTWSVVRRVVIAGLPPATVPWGDPFARGTGISASVGEFSGLGSGSGTRPHVPLDTPTIPSQAVWCSGRRPAVGGS